MNRTEPISVVLLAHNEVEVIERVVREFYDQIVPKLNGSEVIVAEDGSTDGTKEVLARLVGELPYLRWEEGKERRGYVNAFKAAMALPVNEYILFCDSSGKHDPADIWKMYDKIQLADMVVGYKINRQDPLYRILISIVFNFLVNLYFDVNFKDINCPIRLFRKTPFVDIASQNWLEKALINFELTLRFVYRGYRVEQVPVRHFPRTSGPSRGLPLAKIPKVILSALKVFPKLKYRISRPEYRRTR